MGKRNKTKVYSSRKIKLTPEEKKELDSKIQAQVDKYNRDLKCGGVDQNGQFIRLHDRCWG